MKKDKKVKLQDEKNVQDVEVLKKSKPKKIKKTTKEKVDQVITDGLVKVVNGTQAKKKNKNSKKPKSISVQSIEDKKIQHKVDKTAKDLNESDIAKIEKKKAKKLAQKLRKQEKKALGGQEKINDKKTEEKTLQSKEGKKNKLEKKKNKRKEENIVGIAKTEISGEPNSAAQTAKNEKKQHKNEKKKKKLQELKDSKDSSQPIPGEEAATIFVGNLPINTKRVQLVKLFHDFGPVNAVRFRTGSGKIIFKHKHRLGAGTLNAYIVLKDAESANRALALNGTEFKTNHLRVTRADKNAHNSIDSGAKCTVFVGNLKYTATEEKLREIFSSCGEIEYIRSLRDGEKGCKGVAYICFKAPEAVGLALELNETMLDERPIHVERYSVKKLGAKQSRDAVQKASQKPLTGAKKRLNTNNKKQVNGKSPKKSSDSSENKNKGEFRGVKVDGIKKKQKKKKPSSQMQQLAKKIAPKTA